MGTFSNDVTRENCNQIVRETREYVSHSFPTFGENPTDAEEALRIQRWLEDSIHKIERNFFSSGMLRGWCYKILVEEVREQIGIDLADSVAALSDELGYNSGAVISKILRELKYPDILNPAPVAIQYDVALDVTKCKS